ncbi:MAG: hypothetical protein WCE32_18890, partial [Pseudolabrys sp.]
CVRFGSEAGITLGPPNVRFTFKSRAKVAQEPLKRARTELKLAKQHQVGAVGTGFQPEDDTAT